MNLTIFILVAIATMTSVSSAESCEVGNLIKIFESLLLTGKGTTTVAFSAYANKYTKYSRKHAVVIFDVVDLNLGNAYNPQNGIFTCPENGIYTFTWSLGVPAGRTFFTRLVLNGAIRRKNSAFNKNVSASTQSSSSIILALKQGDRVWIRTHDANDNEIYDDMYSSFQGMKI